MSARTLAIGRVAYFSAIGFSPDGKPIISGQRDGNLKLWDLATGAVAASRRILWQHQPSLDLLQSPGASRNGPAAQIQA
jgi:WD40 repeat protein